MQYFHQWQDGRAPSVQVAEGDTTTCARVSAYTVHVWLSPIATCTGCAIHSATSTDSTLAHVVVSPSALVVFFYPATGASTALAFGQLVLCGGGMRIPFASNCTKIRL